MLDPDYAAEVAPHVRAAIDRLRDPQAVWDIFRDERTVAEMERLTALNRPAVAAASVKLLALGDWVRGRDPKTTFGKIAHAVLAKRGYAIAAKGVATPTDPLFTKGARYHLREHPEIRATLAMLKLTPELEQRLRARAARNHRSIAAEAHQIMVEALGAEEKPPSGETFAQAIHARFQVLGGVEELPVHPSVPTEPPSEIGR